MTSLPANVGNKGIEVLKIRTEENLQHAWRIRNEVFVVGQQIPAQDEFDKFENEATHFLALYNGFPCGAARWRITERGVKLERFAVLAEYRGKGVGNELVAAVIESIKNPSNPSTKDIYLHSQESAVGFYEKLGFEKLGAPFYECNIKHYKMVK